MPNKKYIEFPPQVACTNVEYDSGGYEKNEDGTIAGYRSPTPVWQLTKYRDGSEECPRFEECDG